jgi:hypothetical protein
MLSEALLLHTGVLTRLGSVDDGTTVSDSTDVEKRLSHSVHLSVATTDVTDVEATVTDGLATVTCMENVLSAAADTPVGVFAGGRPVATNVFRNTSEGWRLWVHHASPVLSGTEATEEENP